MLPTRSSKIACVLVKYLPSWTFPSFDFMFALVRLVVDDNNDDDDDDDDDDDEAEEAVVEEEEEEEEEDIFFDDLLFLPFAFDEGF